MEGTQEMQQK
jgi:U4/U6.U5 tri-snRNP-associated protein 2